MRLSWEITRGWALSKQEITWEITAKGQEVIIEHIYTKSKYKTNMSFRATEILQVICPLIMYIWSNFKKLTKK